MAGEPLLLVFVHGWSVTSKDTYGDLPEAVQAAARAAGIQVELRHVFLGRYISFHDEVTLDDIARAMDHALRVDIPQNQAGRRVFSCITHSTGGPLVRRWVDMFFGPDKLSQCPMRHLVMLAPANHGSALAILGKGRLGRIKAWFGGVEPGQGVLDSLCLGSETSWALQERFLGYSIRSTGFYPFVLSGETIDEKFYDFLNPYLVEKGSDGVIRLAGANLNYTYLRLEQTDEPLPRGGGATRLVRAARGRMRPEPTGFGVIVNASHSGPSIGIMRSVNRGNADRKPVVGEIVKCLQVGSDDAYEARRGELVDLTEAAQAYNAKRVYKGKALRRFVMFVIRVTDDQGATINREHYDVVLLGDGDRGDRMPKGFFVDRQMNPKSHALTYYMDYEALVTAESIGVRIDARPVYRKVAGGKALGFAGYVPAEFRADGKTLKEYLKPNETMYLDIRMKRRVDQEAMRFDELRKGKGSFKKTQPGGPIP